MLENEHLKEQMGAFASKYGPRTILPATVLSINGDDTVSVLFSDGTEIDDCRLKAVVKDGNKMVLVPKVSTEVLCARIENSDEFVVISVNEVDKIITELGTVRQQVDEDGFVFSKENDTMWDAVKLLIEALELAVILQGKNIDRNKLAQAKIKFKNILNGA